MGYDRTWDTTVHGIRPPVTVDLEASIAENSKQKWKNYVTIIQIRKQPADYQVALLFHTVGDGALRTYNEFSFDTDNDALTI